MSVKPRILICDDQQKWVRIIKDLLGRSYSVEAVNTVDDSKKSLEKDRQKDLRSRYAAVIVDLEFKNLKTGQFESEAGFNILQSARIDPLLESIVYTAIGNEKSAYRAISEGAFGFVPKDHTRKDADLLWTVERAVALHERSLNLIDEIETLATANPGLHALGELRTHFIEYIRQVRGRGR